VGGIGRKRLRCYGLLAGVGEHLGGGGCCISLYGGIVVVCSQMVIVVMWLKYGIA